MEEAPAGNYFSWSPAATEVETTSSPWREEEAPTGLPSGLQAVQQQSHRVPVKEDCPNHPGARQDAGETYEDINTHSNEHFV